MAADDKSNPKTANFKMAFIFQLPPLFAGPRPDGGYGPLGSPLNAVMTVDTHERASERGAEAGAKIEKERSTTIDYALMIQGDEPMLEPAMLDQLVSVAMKSPNAEVVNLMARIEGPEEFESSNTVKFVVDREGNALYFSREPIPSKRKYRGSDEAAFLE